MSSSAGDKPLREKLEQWRALKQGEATTIVAIAGESVSQQKTNPGNWYRSVPTARRTNLIIKGTEQTKNSTKSRCALFPKKDVKENVDIGNDSHLKNALTNAINKSECTAKDTNNEIIKLRSQNKEYLKKLLKSKELLQEATAAGMLALEEVSAVNFLNEVLQQQNLELECQISSERLTVNENASEKSRKHKADMEKLKREKDMFESRANELVAQLNDQMSQLQTVAMSRISDLEQQLMEERTKSAQLEQQLSKTLQQHADKMHHQELLEEDSCDDDSSTCDSEDTLDKSECEHELGIDEEIET